MSAARRIALLTGQLSQSANAPQVVSQPTAATKKPVKVVITGAAGQIAYSLVFQVASGAMLGADQPIELRLLDLPVCEKALQGVIMEIHDCAFPTLTSVIGTSDYKTAFLDVDVAMLVGAKPRGPGMQRKDLLTANAAIFSGQGKALNQFASRNVKVVVVGNPANTNALITIKNAPDLPPQNITALTRLDFNRGAAQIANRLKVGVSQIKNIVIWGNHSKTQYPDVNHGYIKDYPAPFLSTPIRAAVNDNKWLDGEFLSTVQDRGAAIISARGKSSAASAGNAAVDHIRDWVLGTASGDIASMAVISDGSYGVPKDLVFSFPVTCVNGSWKIVQGLKIDAASQKLIDSTTKELLEERKDALGF